MAAQAEAADAAPFVIFETSLGAFSVELYSQHAPQSCKNFRELARTGYYDSTTFHRVIAPERLASSLAPRNTPAAAQQSSPGAQWRPKPKPPTRLPM